MRDFFGSFEMDFPYVFFFCRIFASIACVIIYIVEQKSLGEVIPYLLQWDSMGKPKKSPLPDCRNVPWQDTPSTEASGIQEERKSGEKMSGNTPAPMDGASGGSMGGESGQMNGGCPGCMGCGMGPMGCPCGGCNIGCPCGGMGCPCGGMMMPMMMQLGLFFRSAGSRKKRKKMEKREWK